METTKEQRAEWLEGWEDDYDLFKDGGLGSDREAGSPEGVMRALCRDVDAVVVALERIGYDETTSYLACPGPPNCDGSHYDSCPVAIARAVLREPQSASAQA